MLDRTLTPAPEVSNTGALLDRVAEILHGLDSKTAQVRPVDHRIPFGTSPSSAATSGL